jgi:hypothetical protein
MVCNVRFSAVTSGTFFPVLYGVLLPCSPRVGVAYFGRGDCFGCGYVFAYGTFLVPVSGNGFGCGRVYFPVPWGMVCCVRFRAVTGGTFMPVLYGVA